MTRSWIARVAALLLLILSVQSTGRGQAANLPADLSTRLHERYDVVALQQGVALVPLQATGDVRMIQIVDGVVTVDGVALTGQELRVRLGPDADLVLETSYLDSTRQRELAGGQTRGPAAAGPESEPAGAGERGRVTRGDRVRFGGDITVGADERIQGDVVSLGGSVTVEGEVTGDVVAIGGPVTLGPGAIVRRDLSVIGGSLSRAPGAQVFGETNEVGGGAIGLLASDQRWSRSVGSFWPRFGGLTSTAFRLALLVLVGLIVLAFGRRHLERIAGRAANAPVRSGLIGLLAEILLLPVVLLVVVVLAVSIVGIPLLALVPFAIVLVMLVMLVGFVGLAYQVGRTLTGRFGWTGRGDYLAVALGIVAIGGLTLIAKLAALAGGALLGVPLTAAGYVVEYVAWTVGFGATLLAVYETQTQSGSGRPTPPEVPLPQPSA